MTGIAVMTSGWHAAKPIDRGRITVNLRKLKRWPLVLTLAAALLPWSRK